MNTKIQNYFSLIKTTNEGWKANCPRCEDTTFCFHWSTEKNVGCCHHASCAWYQGSGGVTERRLRAFFSEEDTPYEIPEIIEAAEHADVKLPEEFQLLDNLKNDIRVDLFDYFHSRRIEKWLLRKARVGYCRTGKFWGYIIMPVFNDEGEVAWWQGRRYKNRTPKFYNPASSQKTDLLYRLSSPKKPHRIVLVESIINSWTLAKESESKRNVVGALLGKTMSEAQMDIILSKEKWVEEAVVALDPDALREAVALAEKLCPVIPKVKIMRVPEGEDINTLGFHTSWKLINDAPIFDPKHRTEFLVGAS